MNKQLRTFWLSLGVGMALVALLVSIFLFVVYPFFLYPKFKPMLDYGWALNLSRTLSQLSLDDLSSESIDVPKENTKMSHQQIQLMLKRLHETGKFVDWRPDLSLQDSDGDPFVFYLKPRESKNPSIWISSENPGYTFRQGDFTVTITSLSGKVLAEN